MLRSLSIRDFVIVDTLDLDFSAGFTVFTGETGAGKSILIDALALVLGERADAGVVREGAARASISATFHPPALDAWLAERELAGDDDTVLLRRTVDASGRSKAFINGAAATLAQLREVGDQLVDIHGQHAHQLLLRPDAQRQLFDAHAGLTEQAAAVAEAWRVWRACVSSARRWSTSRARCSSSASGWNGRSASSTSSRRSRANGKRSSPNTTACRMRPA
jgi:DNA repair protein RecN (Recombination protein N)